MTRRPCSLCGSRQWHKEPSSGSIVCSEGHVLQDYRKETTEMEYLGAHGVRKRAVKSTRTKKDKVDLNQYHGERGRFHYFECQQLLLRHQIVALTKLWKLPAEFEVVCRDIWALHLSLIPEPPPAEPYLHMQERRGEHSEEVLSDDDDDLGALLRLNSESDNDGTSNDELAPTGLSIKGKKKGRRKRGRGGAYDGPASLIAVLVVACWTMRLGKLYTDFVRAIDAHELPYLEPLRVLPRGITMHLTKHAVQALRPAHAPRTLTLHALSSRLVRRMWEEYGVCTPEGNCGPILWRVIEGLGGTPMLYELTKRVSEALSLPVRLGNDPSPAAPLGGVVRHRYDNVPAEVAFSCAACVGLRMVDGQEGYLRRGARTEPRPSMDKSNTAIDEYLLFLRGTLTVSCYDDGIADDDRSIISKYFIGSIQ